MKLNGVNKIYISIAVLLVAAIAVKLVRYQSWNRYYYAASVCAPETYPVYVREIAFLTAGGNERVYVKTEDVYSFNSSWGVEDYFAEANEANMLPEKLVLKYASFREGSFYNDTIALPTDSIKTIFTASLKDKRAIDIYYKGQQKPGLSFLIGIANNGNIIVWLRDKLHETTIARAKIKEKVPTQDDTYYGGPLTKEEYLKEAFNRLDDSLKTLIKGGFDANANYIDSSSGY